MAKPKPKPTKKLGRESQLKDPCRQAILDAIILRLSYKEACHIAGIGYSTFRRWMQQGKYDESVKKDSAFRAFWADIKKAQTEYIFNNLNNIQKIADGEGGQSFYASAWLLERRFPERYGLRAQEIRELIKRGEEQDKKIAELMAALKASRPIEETPAVSAEGG